MTIEPLPNFRRIIAAFIPAGEFCNHKVNYLPEHTSRLPLRFILAFLNSKLSDWYFRLGSTNAAVSHYQLYNLPCPVFRDNPEPADMGVFEESLGRLAVEDFEGALTVLTPGATHSPFSTAIRDVIVEAVERIIEIEAGRGEIPRAARSALAPAAQPYQNFIDRLFYLMAGLTEAEAEGLEHRLDEML